MTAPRFALRERLTAAKLNLVSDAVDAAAGAGAVTSVAGKIGAVTLAGTDLSATGIPDATTFLRGDNSWATPAGGAVTSVAGRTGVVTIASTDITDSTTSGRALLTAATTAAQKTALAIAAADITDGTTAGRALLTAASAAAQKTALAVASADITDGTAAGRALLTGASATAQRTSLGLGGAATLAVGTTAGTVAAGDDARITGALPKAGGTMTGRLVSTPAALTDAVTIATDASLANTFSVTLAGNRTLGNPTNLVAGTDVRWIIKQDATGSRTLAYGTAYKFPGATAPVLTTAANSVDILTGYTDGTVVYCNITKDLR